MPILSLSAPSPRSANDRVVDVITFGVSIFILVTIGRGLSQR